MRRSARDRRVLDERAAEGVEDLTAERDVAGQPLAFGDRDADLPRLEALALAEAGLQDELVAIVTIVAIDAEDACGLGVEDLRRAAGDEHETVVQRHLPQVAHQLAGGLRQSPEPEPRCCGQRLRVRGARPRGRRRLGSEMRTAGLGLLHDRLSGMPRRTRAPAGQPRLTMFP